MSTSPTTPIAAWKLPLIVAAVAVGIVGGIYVGGAGVGLAMGGLAAASIVAMAIRKPPVYPIEPPVPAEFRRHLLVVLATPIDESAELEHLLDRIGSPATDPAPAIRLTAPARHGRLARWTSDLEPGRESARRVLVQGAALLAKAGFAADARVSDEGIEQSVEDELRTFPATEVMLVAAPGARTNEAIAALEARLTVPLGRVAGAVGVAHAKLAERTPDGRSRVEDRNTGTRPG